MSSQCPPTQTPANPQEPQVFWLGVIICTFSVIILSFPSMAIYNSATTGEANHAVTEVWLVFGLAVFLTIGSYMIRSDKQRKMKTSRPASALTKAKIAILIIPIVVGVLLIAVSFTPMTSTVRYEQIAHKNNALGSNNVSFFTERGTIDVAMTFQAEEIGKKYNISANRIEENHTLFVYNGIIGSQTQEFGFTAETSGNYRISWDKTNVTQVIVYRVQPVTPVVTHDALSAMGIFSLVSSVPALFRFKRGELFYGNKPRLFWWGQIIFGAAYSMLFAFLWYAFIIYQFQLSSDFIVQVSGSIAFMVIGFFMIAQGAKEPNRLIPSTTILNKSISRSNLRTQTKIPWGVGIWAVFAMLSSFVFGFVIYVSLIAQGIGGYEYYSSYTMPLRTQVMLWVLAIIGLTSFGASIAILKGARSKVIWYTMIGIWSGLIVYATSIHTQFWLGFESSTWRTLVILAPYLYSICGITYFLTKKPREYFQISLPHIRKMHEPL
jgi:hypothetical protein